ncbi:ATPase [Candidatus Peregrinibacteria bacterium]|nr:MAG: ATPase [Candidatus Peregrinibacteria bacterium]
MTENKHLVKLQTAQDELRKVIVGQENLIRNLFIALLSRGHILLEGVPGLAKTMAISTLSKILSGDFQRIQFTPDLLPSDILGSQIFNAKTTDFDIKKGPIFSHFVLADEINRSPAKVQSALLEAMQERQVTLGDETMKLPDIFMVLATENPIEQEGTYALPEAQVDRFLLKTILDYPTPEEELLILHRFEKNHIPDVKKILTLSDIKALQTLSDNVFIEDSLKQYIVNIVTASRSGEYIEYGASPRASLGIMNAAKSFAVLQNRDFVLPEDIKTVTPDVLRHRIGLSYEAEAEDIKIETVIHKILETIKVP